MPELNASFWSQRYQEGTTGWDIGYAAPAIISYFEPLNDKDIQILIPGGGNGYEAERLYNMGFRNIFLLDWSDLPLKNFAARNPAFPKEQLVQGDFFEHDGNYDIIIEQTFFCAINPTLRDSYVEKMHQLLKPGGKLVGLMFNDPLNDDHPPYGGSKEEYLKRFEPYFEVKQMDTANNSIAPRAGRELFIELVKK